MQQIIAIGGFGIETDSAKFGRYLITQTQKESPNVCFLPQASAEDKSYIIRFYENFSGLGAKPSWLSLYGRVEKSWKEKILAQDLIFVGGGNTRSMLALWREWGVDKVLKEAYMNGTVLSGVSAGAICWFQECITDSVWPLGSLEGLGFLKGSCCPHYDSEPERRPTFLTKVKTKEVSSGIALEDSTAAHYIDGDLKTILVTDKSKKAYLVSVNGEENIASSMMTL